MKRRGALGRWDAETRGHGDAGMVPHFSVSPRLRDSAFLRVSVSVLLLALLFASESEACSVCFVGESDSPMAQGMNNAIWVLLAIVGVVQIGFVALFWSFWRRARAIRKRREQFRLIQGLVR
jgi:uncharacterized membrane protein